MTIARDRAAARQQCRCSDAVAARRIGVAVQPEFVVWRDLRAGRLEAVMGDWSAPPIALNIVTPPGGPRPPKVAALIEFLVRRFSERAAPWAKP